jgi:hypothetical protein
VKHIGYRPYEPQLMPVQQAESIWTVEGPEVCFRLGGLTIPCPTRMTVVKLADGSLMLHSPVSYTIELDQALAAFEPISALIAPNNYHYLHVRNWAATHPHADDFASSDIMQKIRVSNVASLGIELLAGWGRDLEHLLINLEKFSEAVFFHRASRTLIMTDLMQTFEASRVRSLVTRILLTLGGATGPNARPSPLEVGSVAQRLTVPPKWSGPPFHR